VTFFCFVVAVGSCCCGVVDDDSADDGVEHDDGVADASLSLLHSSLSLFEVDDDE
jgi:hypothetical protein